MNWQTFGNEPRILCLLAAVLVIPALACDNTRATYNSTATQQTEPHQAEGSTTKAALQDGDQQSGKTSPQESSTKTKPETKAQAEPTKPQSPIDAAIVHLKEQRVRDDLPEVVPAAVHEALQPMVEKSWTRLHPGFEIWLDMKNRQVIVGGRISLREGLLEMFACPQGTKEHESVVSTISNAELVHAGLLAIGAVPGKPIQWQEEPIPASGPVTKVTVQWKEGDEVKSSPAQKMILDEKTGKPLAHDWVFCGSGTWTDPDTGRREYFANFGDMICVSSFPTAMMDLPIFSTDANVGLQFSALKENIPPLGTPVLLLLKPELAAK